LDDINEQIEDLRQEIADLEAQGGIEVQAHIDIVRHALGQVDRSRPVTLVLNDGRTLTGGLRFGTLAGFVTPGSTRVKPFNEQSQRFTHGAVRSIHQEEQ
jgi:hypothetical protein